MATKVIVLGKQPEPKELKKIEFQSWLDLDDPKKLAKTVSDPNTFETIELVSKHYQNGYDLMFAYSDDNRRNGILFIGQFNDGVV